MVLICGMVIVESWSIHIHRNTLRMFPSQHSFGVVYAKSQLLILQLTCIKYIPSYSWKWEGRGKNKIALWKGRLFFEDFLKFEWLSSIGHPGKLQSTNTLLLQLSKGWNSHFDLWDFLPATKIINLFNKIRLKKSSLNCIFFFQLVKCQIRALEIFQNTRFISHCERSFKGSPYALRVEYSGLGPTPINSKIK